MNARVGVGCFVLSNDGKRFITGLRKGSHGAGSIQLPGGHLELGESFERCASREIIEETGLAVENIQFLTATNDVFNQGEAMKHYVTIFMTCRVTGDDPDPKVMEPDKCESWRWSTYEQLKELPRESLFLPLQNLILTRPEIIPTR